MMKRIIFAVLLSLVWCPGFAQNELIDSLKKELVNARQDTNKVNILVELTNASSDPENKLYYAREGINVSKRIGYAKGEATCLFKMSWAYVYAGDVVSASESIQKSLEIFKKIKYDKGIMMALEAYSNHYYLQNDFKNELYVCHLPALKIAQKLKDTSWAELILGNIGKTYSTLGQFDSSEIYLAEAYRLTRQTKTPPRDVVAYILSQLGNLKMLRNEKEPALAYLQQALILLKEEKDEQSTGYVYNDLSKLYLNANQLDSSLYFALKAFNITGNMRDSLELLAQTGEQLSLVYEKMNDPKTALRFYKMAAAAKDTFYNHEKWNKLAGLTFREKQREIELAAARKEYQNRVFIYLTLAGLLVFLLIASVLYYHNKQKEKINSSLKKALSELQSTQSQLIQSEKLASLGELTAGIAHEIQNPLNFVNNFSELSVDLAKELNDELEKDSIDKAFVKELMSDLTQNQQKINLHGKRAASIVTGMLQHARTSTGKKEPTDLNALADEYLRLAYHGLRAKDPNFNAAMVTHFDPAVGKVDVIPQDMGRVLLNLINNAFYAVSQRALVGAPLVGAQPADTRHAGAHEGHPYEPTVAVSTQKTDNQIIIKVKDNGTGIPDDVKARIFQPFFTTKPTGQGTGLGLSLAYDIVVKGHGGTLAVESMEGAGTEFVMRLPF